MLHVQRVSKHITTILFLAGRKAFRAGRDRDKCGSGCPVVPIQVIVQPWGQTLGWRGCH